MRSLILLPLFALCACATLSPEQRVREKLIEAGLKPHMAKCIAEHLVDKLSVAQLKQLGRAASLPRKDVGKMSLDEMLDRLRAIHDPEIVAVATRAGLSCAISH